MTIKDLTAAITPNLTLTVGDKTYSVAPPNKEDGAIMLAIHRSAVASLTAVTGACDKCGRAGAAEISDEDRALLEANKDRTLGELALGDTFAQIEADWDAKTTEKLELYASYYWTFGETYADAWLEQMGSMGGAGSAPKAQAASKSGRSTASAKSSTTRRKATRSTPTTASRKK